MNEQFRIFLKAYVVFATAIAIWFLGTRNDKLELIEQFDSELIELTEDRERTLATIDSVREQTNRCYEIVGRYDIKKYLNEQEASEQ